MSFKGGLELGSISIFLTIEISIATNILVSLMNSVLRWLMNIFFSKLYKNTFVTCFFFKFYVKNVGSDRFVTLNWEKRQYFSFTFLKFSISCFFFEIVVSYKYILFYWFYIENGLDILFYLFRIDFLFDFVHWAKLKAISTYSRKKIVEISQKITF